MRECFEAYSEFGIDAIQSAMNEALLNNGFSDNVLDYRPNLEKFKSAGIGRGLCFPSFSLYGECFSIYELGKYGTSTCGRCSEQLKRDIKKVHSGIYDMQEKLREYKKDEEE